MAKKSSLFQIITSNVAASTTDTVVSVIPAVGRTVKITKLGASFQSIGDCYVTFEWGSTGDWEYIRMLVVSAEIEVNREFVGDGLKRFRITRKNDQAAPKRMVAWVEGLIHDA